MKMDGIDPREVKFVWGMCESYHWGTCVDWSCDIRVGLIIMDWNLRVDFPLGRLSVTGGGFSLERIWDVDGITGNWNLKVVFGFGIGLHSKASGASQGKW